MSFTHRSIAAIRYEVEPLDGPARVVAQSELVANEPLPRLNGDPRVATVLNAPLRPEHDAADCGWAVLVHRTKRSGLRVGTAMDHVVEGTGARVTSASEPDEARVSVTATLRPGQPLRVTLAWTDFPSTPAASVNLNNDLDLVQVRANRARIEHAVLQGLGGR